MNAELVTQLGLKNETQIELAETIRESAQILGRLGIDVKAFSKKGLAYLSQRPDDELRAKLQSVRETLKDLVLAESAGGEKERERPVSERFMAVALKRLNWQISDHFWEELSKGRLVEIYGPEMVQVFRSLNFFEYSGYSLLDLTLHEWFVLYERPRSIMESMHEHVELALKKSLEFAPCSIPEHIMRQNFNDGLSEPFEPRCALVKFAHIGIAKDDRGATVGFAVSSEASIVSRGAEANIIGFV